MPNWCYNELEVTGSAKYVSMFVDFVKSKERDLDFNSIIPYPKGLEYSPFGYDWCISNWGTKWNACEVSADVTEELAIYHFDTAWSPSIPVTRALANAFPELTFRHAYEESMMDFSGYAIFQNGDEVEEMQGTYAEYPIGELSDEYYEEEDEETE